MSSISPVRVFRALDGFKQDTQTAPEEPAQDRGTVIAMPPGGPAKVLKWSGESQPDAGPDGPDIPADAVSNNRVVLYVDGIHTTLQGEEQSIAGLLQSSDPKFGNVQQTVIGVQEGVGKDIVADALRITKDFEVLKGLQSHVTSPEVLKVAAYLADPAIKSVHDEIRQSLAAGRDVQVVLHSGGGAETCVALALLQQEDGGKFASSIAQHVRVLAMAPAASPQDFELAGVAPQNLYYTGSHQDPVFTTFHDYVEPKHQKEFLKDALAGLEAGFKPGAIEFHNPFYIFQNNAGADGSQPIQQFLDGGPGQIRTI